MSKELSDAIDVPLNMAMKEPCLESGKRNCIDDQIAVKNGRSVGWHGADPKKMCRSCACYWHLACARNFALGVPR